MCVEHLSVLEDDVCMAIAEIICSAISIRPGIRSHFHGVKLTPYGRPNAYGRTDDFSLCLCSKMMGSTG